MEKESPSFRKLRYLTLLSSCLAFLFFLFFDRSKHQLALSKVNPFIEDPFDAVGSFGIQLALLAVLLSLVRVFRPYPASQLSDKAVLRVLRSNIVTLLSIFVTLVSDLVAVLRFPQVWIRSASGWLLVGFALGLLALTILVICLIFQFGRSYGLSFPVRPWRKAAAVSLAGLSILAIYPETWCQSTPGAIFAILVGIAFLFLLVSALAQLIFPAADLKPAAGSSLPVEQPIEDAFVDLVALYRWLQVHAGPADFLFSWVQKIARVAWIRALLNWINPRKHVGKPSWNLAILLGLGVGVFFFLAEAASEGMPGRRVLLTVFAVFISMEGVGVLTGYLLLNQYLGIFLT